MHWECRYCDRPAGYMGIPIAVGDELICACGAEWADAKIMVEDENYDYEDIEYEEDDDYYDDGRLDCGCCSCCGCNCNDYYEEDYDDEEQ